MSLIHKLAAISRQDAEAWKSRHSTVGRMFLGRPEALDRLMRKALLQKMPDNFITPVIKRALISPGRLADAIKLIKKEMAKSLTGFESVLNEGIKRILSGISSINSSNHPDLEVSMTKMAEKKRLYLDGELGGKERDSLDSILAHVFDDIWTDYYELMRLAESSVKKPVSQEFMARLAMSMEISLDTLASMKEDEQVQDVLLDPFEVDSVEKSATAWLIKTLKEHFLEEIEAIDQILKSPAELTSPLAASFRGYLLSDMKEIQEKMPSVTDISFTELCESMDMRFEKVVKGFDAGKAKKKFSQTLSKLSGKADNNPFADVKAAFGSSSEPKLTLKRSIDIVNVVRDDRHNCLYGEMSLEDFMEKYTD